MAMLGVISARRAARRRPSRAPGRSAPLSGTIYDVTGGVLRASRVTLMDANQLPWAVVTNASGRFEFLHGAGHVRGGVTLAGFRTLRHEFELRDARDWDRAVTLQVGDLRERSRFGRVA
jgi:hypothetical protein